MNKIIIIFLILINILLKTDSSVAQTIKFYQYDFSMDSVTQFNSDWGGLELQYDSFPGTMYVNLSTDLPGTTTQWQIQNLLISKYGSDTEKTLIYFDIGDTSVEVNSINYGLSLTPFPLNEQPIINSTDSVFSKTIEINSGIYGLDTDKSEIENTYFDNNSDQAVPTVGGTPVNTAGIDNKHRVNQEAGKNECVPVAISNSVKFLNSMYNLNIPIFKTTIEFMKYAVGFIPDKGAPVNFADLKRNWFSMNNIPITTREYKLDIDMDKIMCELSRNQDVEITVERYYYHWLWGSIQIAAHTAQISSISYLGEGRYELEISHDTEQDKIGGRERSYTIFDTRVNKFTAGIFKRYNLGIHSIIVECPVNNSSCTVYGTDILAKESYSMYSEKFLKGGYWTLVNFDADASIVWQNDSDAYIYSGNNSGTFRLYYKKVFQSNNEICYPIYCNKIVYVDDPLPAEIALLQPDVYQNEITLKWITYSEKNNYGFDIERSYFNGEWIKAGFAKGNINSEISRYYSFTDKGLNSGVYKYRLKQLDYNGTFSYSEFGNEIVIGVPNKLILLQNYPNPFNSMTRIDFGIPEYGIAELKLYDISGKQIKLLLNEYKPEGYYNLIVNTEDFASGIYFYVLKVKNNILVRKMMLIK